MKPLASTGSNRLAKTALKCVSLFVVAVAMVATSYAQNSGSVRGQVKNLTTGKSLYNALVTIEETGQSTYTDEYGTYRFSNVPSGSKTVTATFVGLQKKSVTVDVTTGVTATGNLALYSNRYGLQDEEVFELEAVIVEGSSYDSNVIALNEQRNSSNLKSVQHAEAFGEIAEGNIGEYLKNLPGVSVNYVAADVRSIKMRGMSPAFTQVTVDGSQMASAGSGNKIRSFELEQVSLANVELLEVSKLPRPDMSANAIGGSVNLVSKNAFAQDGRRLDYKVSLNFNNHESSLSKSPGWVADGSRSKVLPGVEINYADVFMDDRLGVAMTYKNSNMFNVQQRFRWREWDLSPQGGNGSAEDAYFLRLEVQDGPKKTSRESLSANVDFKVSDDSTFSFRAQTNSYDATFFNRNASWRIRALGDLSDAGIAGSTDSISNNAYTFGENRGIGFGGSFRAKFGNTYHVDMGMKQYIGDWVIDYGLSKSEATNHYASNARGFMETWEAADRGDTEYLAFNQGNSDMIAFSDIVAYDEDMNVIANRGLNLGDFELRRTRERPKESVDRIDGLRVNARRNFKLGENQGYFQFGARTSRQERSGYQLELRYQYDGYNTDGEQIWFDTIKDQTFSGHSPGFGYEGFDWPSIQQIHTIFNADRSVWDLDETRSVNNTIGTWFEMEEDIDAVYAMGQMKFVDDRLSILAGVRHEDTTARGTVPIVSSENFVRSPSDFGFVTTNVIGSYGTTHPSVHLKFDATDKLVLRLSYANTIGRADFGDMFGPTTIRTPEFDNGLPPTDPDYELTDPTSRGSITLTNPGLEPRESDNIDFTAEYYYGETGVFSVSAFRNKMKNFINSSTRQVTDSDVSTYGLPGFVLGTAVTQSDIDRYGLTDDILGSAFTHDLRVAENIANATIEGLEVNWKQDIAFDSLPQFLRGSSIYANGTFLSTEADPSAGPYQNDFQDFAKTTVNYGYLYDQGPLNFKFRWNIRGDEIGGSTREWAVNGMSSSADDEDDIYPTALYREKRIQLDFDFGYKINDRTSLFVNARNLTEEPFRQGYYLPNSDGSRRFILEREERFGTQWTVGVKGKF